MKKILSLLLSISIMFSVFSTTISVNATEQNSISVQSSEISYKIATIDMFSHYVNNGYMVLHSYNGDYENIFIPHDIEYNGKIYPVSISTLFQNNQTVKNVLFASDIHITQLTNMCYNATNLESILINNGSFKNEDEQQWNIQNFFTNCYSLKSYFDFTDINNNGKFYMANCVSLETITSLPNCDDIEFYVYNGSYDYTSTNLKKISCNIPSKCTKLVLRATNITGDIKFDTDELNEFEITSKTTAPYFNTSSVNCIVNSGSKTELTIKKFIASGRHTITVQSVSTPKCYNNIYILGDSLTANTNYYYNTLSDLVDEQTILHNYGIEGDTSYNLLTRTGENKVFVTNDFVIPKSTTPVKINLSTNFTNTISKVSQDTGGVNLAQINSVSGFITYNESEKAYYFTRLESGEEINVSSNTEIITQFETVYSKGEKLIIYIGTNDYSVGMSNDYNKALKLKENIDKIIDYTQCDDYIVVGLAFRTANQNNACSNENSITYENLMQETYGDRFLNLREYFIENAYNICSELECDDSEQEQLKQGIVPLEFFADSGTHWNSSTGGKVVASAIYEKINSIDNFINVSGCKEKTTTTKATLSQNGTIVKTCSICGKKTTTTIYSPKTISLSTTSYTYNGNVRKPVVTVKDSKGNTLKNGTDYTLTYASGRKNVGKYSVKVTFKGNYSGSKTLYFTIKPKSTSISKLTAKSKGFTVKWNKQATQTTGYQIQYSTSSSFSNAKTKTISGASNTSRTVSNLSYKKYYVRVRTYKTVNGTNYYSAWSGYKSVTTK